MCGIPSVLGPIGQAVGIIGDIQSAVSGMVVGKYNEKLLREQAQIAENNAIYERQKGIEDARQKRLDAIKNLGKQKTTIASGNILLSSSTALSLFEDEKITGELEAVNLLGSSERKAQSYMDTAKNYYSKASLTSYKSVNDFSNKLIKSSSDIFSLTSSFK